MTNNKPRLRGYYGYQDNRQYEFKESYFFLVSLRYWNKHGHIKDSEISDKHLSDSFYQGAESMFTYTGTDEDAIKELKSLGYVEKSCLAD